MTPKLDSRRPPSLDGEASFSYQGYFDHMEFELAGVQQRLTAAEDGHRQKVVQAVQLRRESKELNRTVYDKQSSARQVLAGYHGGDRGFEVAAVSGPTPQVSQPLSEQVDQTVSFGLLPSRVARSHMNKNTARGLSPFGVSDQNATNSNTLPAISRLIL